MKKFRVFALLFVLGFIFTSFVKAEETVKTEASAGVSTAIAAVPEVHPDPDAETLREAWSAVKDSRKDLAERLQKIWAGDRTNADKVLLETASVIKGDDADLASRLEKMAATRILGPDSEILKEAWMAIKDSNSDLAGRLKKIWVGDQTGADKVLLETAGAVRGDDPGLAAKLEKLAAHLANNKS